MNITRMHDVAAFTAAALLTLAMLMGVDSLASGPVQDAQWAQPAPARS
jgi:hypothetical protein